VTAPRTHQFFGLLPRDGALRAALGWGALVLVSVLLAGPGARVGEAEGRFQASSSRHGGWWLGLPLEPLDSLSNIAAALGPERGAAGLPLATAGIGHALLVERLPGGELFSHRLAAALFAALLAYVLSRFGGDLAGLTGALLAPALTFFVPACFDAAIATGTAVPTAALWLGVLLAHSRGLRSRDHRERIRRAAVAAILFGAAVATRRDAWALLPLLTLHYLLVRSRGGLRALQADEDEAPHRHPAGRSAWRSLLAGLPSSVPAMLLLGPLVFAAFTPWIWIDPIRRVLPAIWATLDASPFVHLGTVVAGGRPPWHAPLLAALLLPPASIGFLYLAGLFHAGRRLVLGWRGEAAASFSEELLLLLGALVPLVLAATGVAPAEAGIGPVLPALGVLSVLAARAVATAARAAWPAAAPKLALATCILALYPALRATVRTFPHGANAWSEWVGGAPGAASIGLPRLASGAGTALLEEIRERASSGQRIWWPGLPVATLEALRNDGRIRSDLRIATSPADADLAVIEHDDARRDLEYQVWTAFETARPVAGTRLDEVPLASVYARPGAWR
jgi:hypothetical protein